MTGGNSSSKDMASEPKTGLAVGIYYRDLLQPGGMPRETALLAREMSKLVDKLVLYCYVGDPSRAGASRLEGVSVRAFYQPGWRRDKDAFRAPAEMVAALRQNEDALTVLVLMGSFIPENAPVARAARRSGIPYVLSVGAAFDPHLFTGLRGFKKRMYERVFERRVVDEALAIRLYSRAQAPPLTSRGYADDGRFFVAKEGIDWDTIREEGGMEANPTAGGQIEPPTFGFLGRLDVYGKGLDILLEAWSRYRGAGGAGRLLIAGPATPRESVRLDRLRDRFDLTSVTFLPALSGPEKYAFLRSLSYLVLPSRHEGIPRVVREALAVGCPVVVTEDTNLHDLVERFGAGSVVRTDPEDLARTLLALEGSQQDRIAHREGARRAADSLSWEEVARSIVDALTQRIAHV